MICSTETNYTLGEMNQVHMHVLGIIFTIHGRIMFDRTILIPSPRHTLKSPLTILEVKIYNLDVTVKFCHYKIKKERTNASYAISTNCLLNVKEERKTLPIVSSSDKFKMCTSPGSEFFDIFKPLLYFSNKEAVENKHNRMLFYYPQ